MAREMLADDKLSADEIRELIHWLRANRDLSKQHAKVAELIRGMDEIVADGKVTMEERKQLQDLLARL